MTPHGRKALLALGLLALIVPASASAKTATKHHLDMYKVEQHITIPEFQSASPTLQCPNGDIAADGMWRIDEVGPYNAQTADEDETPWDIASGVTVSASYPSSASAYTFAFKNNTSEDAQLKVWATCLGKNTAPDTHGHAFTVSAVNSKSYTGLGQQDLLPAVSELDCGTGEIYIAPGWKVDAGAATPFSSYPESNLREWSYGFYVTKPTTELTIYGRCLTLKTAVANDHDHKLYAHHRNAPVQHFNKGNGVWEHQLSCADHQKGLVGGWSLFKNDQHWDLFNWHFLGMDPRIKARAYKTYNVGANGSFYLVCVNDRTSRPFFT